MLATRGMVSWYYLNFSIRPEDGYLDEAAAYAARALEKGPQNDVGIFLRGLVASNAATWKVRYATFSPHTSRSQAMRWS